MPIFEAVDRFREQFDRLTPQERKAFLAAVAKLVHDLKVGDIRQGLRVKGYQRVPGWLEMTWAKDGRALFEYGESLRPGDRHVIWHRVGGHEILDEP